MDPLRILILSDGRPGHYHLSEGIAAAIARRRACVVETSKVTRGRWPGRVAAAMVNGPLGGRGIMKTLSGHDHDEFPVCDLVVSAGAETLPANVLMARARRVPNIFYGSLRQFRPDDFALVLTSYARAAQRPRHALALKPSSADPDRAGVSRHRLAGAPQIAGLLVGGNSGTFRYDHEDWVGLLRVLEETFLKLGTRWLVSNSRRTGDDFSDALAQLSRAPDTPIARFIDVRQAGSGTLGDIFSSVEAVLCTDDSSSMISEAIWMQLPVIGVRPQKAYLPPDEQHYRDWLQRSDWSRSVPISALTTSTFTAALDEITPLSENPLDALAELVDSRLPGLLG